MPFELPTLDDRSFDDLVAEARARLASHVPEMTNLVPGDPAVAFIDLFAFLTESICYRANLIPERQRRAFLNLLQLPLRPAGAARGVVCIDSNRKAGGLPALLPDGTSLLAGKVEFSTVGELQSLPLALATVVKRPISDEELVKAGVTVDDLRALHGTTVTPFRPEPVTFPGSALSLADTLDHAIYLALHVPTALAKDLTASTVRSSLLGQTLSLAISPLVDQQTEEATTNVPPRRLAVDAIYQAGNAVNSVPLTVLNDSSNGARKVGVLRLRLPALQDYLLPPPQDDPQYAGVGSSPPELPSLIAASQLVCWLRLTCPSDARTAFDYIGVNGVEVVGQQWVKQRVIGIGNGNSDQLAELGNVGIDSDSILLEVQTEHGWDAWSRIEHLAGAGRRARVYLLDPEAGIVRFGDGINGTRPGVGHRIRATYRFGGGLEGNLAPKSITGLSSGSPDYKVRQELPTRGGIAAESVTEAERRIPSFLQSRDRAVSIDDFRALALAHPTAPVARAEVVGNLVPVPTPSLARTDVPGAVSVFVVPPGEPAIAAAPRATVGLLRDVHAYLRERTLIGTELYVLSPIWYPLAVTVCCGVRDITLEQETLRAVERQVLEYLWALAPGGPRANGWPLGYDVDPRELAAVVARVSNVLKVGAIGIFAKQNTTWNRLGLSESLSLGDYALPELMGVSAVADATADPVLPLGLTNRATLANGTQSVPVPVIPDRC